MTDLRAAAVCKGCVWFACRKSSSRMGQDSVGSAFFVTDEYKKKTEVQGFVNSENNDRKTAC